MLTRYTRIFIFLCLIFLNIHRLEATSQLQISQIMTEAEQKKMGIPKLSETERTALESWLTSWSVSLLNKKSPATAPNQSDKLSKEDAFVETLYISHINGSGNQIELNDGSIWKVYPIDVMTAAGWLPRDTVRLLKSTNDQFPYQIHNLSTGGQVKTTLLSGASIVEDGKEKNEEKLQRSISPYAGQLRISSISNGNLASLTDGSVWKINPNDQFKSRFWLKGTFVSLEKSNDSEYPYKLTNTSLQDYVLVKATESP